MSPPGSASGFAKICLSDMIGPISLAAVVGSLNQKGLESKMVV